MNESHPWRDGSQTILFVLAMPVVLLLAFVAEHLVGWVTYATADARERRRQWFHLLAVGSVVTLVVGIGAGEPTPTLIVAGATLALLACLELGRGAAIVKQRLGRPPRGRGVA